MLPEELASHHPVLFHLADAEAFEGIKRHGLLSAATLVEVFEVEAELRAQLLTQRRPKPVRLLHEKHGIAILNDNRPLSEAKLAKCLDDGLSVADWLLMLNSRVFFWADERRLARLKEAPINKERPKIILRLRTLDLVADHAQFAELSPINTGATIHVPARRGLSTFSRLSSHSYPDWRHLRRKNDKIAEVVFTRPIHSIEKYLIDVESVMGGA